MTKRKTSHPRRAALDAARDLCVNVSAVADAALRQAITDAHRQRWLEDNAEAFAAQAAWHEENGHLLAARPGRRRNPAAG